jgi:hypothetical protein
VTVTFQAQNPAISGFYLGWASCTSFSAAMAASFDQGVGLLVTGGLVRRWTGDTTGGTTLAQNDDALTAHTPVRLDVQYRLPWTDFVARINGGEGAVLQGWYEPIAATRYDAGGGFTGNHAVFVPPGWGVMDPLADGRRSGIYKYHGEAYPQALLRTFAGQLNIGSGRIVRLGAGLAYAAFTRNVKAAAPVPTVVSSAPTPIERNVMISQGGLAVVSSHVMALALSQPLFRYPGGPKVTAMSRAGNVDYIGGAGSGWRAVKVTTGAPYGDGVPRPTVLYVPAAAGPVTKK